MAANLDLTNVSVVSSFNQLLHIGDDSLIEAGGAAHYITNGTGTQSALSISTTRVGIGTEAPVGPLHVASTDSICYFDQHSVNTTAPEIVFRKSRHATIGTYTTVLSEDDELGRISFRGSDSQSTPQEGAKISCRADQDWTSTHHGTTLDFYTVINDGTSVDPRMRIDNNGSVGIGTTAPITTLSVIGNITMGATNPTLIFADANQTHDNLSWMYTTGDDTLHMRDNGEGANRIFMPRAGGLGVGVTPTATLQVDGTGFCSSGIYFESINGDHLMSHGTAGSGTNDVFIGNQKITTSSDMRIKKNIVDTESNGLDVINKFRVVDFSWNYPEEEDANNISLNGRGRYTGFLAQEAVKVAPYSINAPRSKEDNTVDYESEQRWFVDYGDFVPILTKAIQELSAKVTALENA